MRCPGGAGKEQERGMLHCILPVNKKGRKDLDRRCALNPRQADIGKPPLQPKNQATPGRQGRNDAIHS